MTEECDFIVIGAGIAGASVAYHLAGTGMVIVLEREDAPGYHATGRSAALFTESYGPPAVRALARASFAFLRSPPPGFAEHPLLARRGALTVARAGGEAALEAMHEDLTSAVDTVCRLDAADALDLCPVLRRGEVAAALYEPEVYDIDVDALLQGFLRGLHARGGRVVTGAGVTGLARADGRWTAETAAGRFAAPVVVNAAGAWADRIAEIAGVKRIGLVPKRRTAINFDAPADIAGDIDCGALPVVGDVDDTYYFRPEAGGVMASPSDETPSPPCDARPEELDVAIAVDRIERATRFAISRVTHSRAGLRSFVADGVPVAGMAPDAEDFCWLAGQGGYGIKTSPALGRVGAALASGEAVPADVEALGCTAQDLGPGRINAPEGG